MPPDLSGFAFPRNGFDDLDAREAEGKGVVGGLDVEIRTIGGGTLAEEAPVQRQRLGVDAGRVADLQVHVTDVLTLGQHGLLEDDLEEAFCDPGFMHDD
jgi:hypothetical protein